MACRSIKTQHGNLVEVEDEIGHPIGLRVENDEGRCVSVYLSIENAREIAKTLEAFATIHAPSSL
jgi:hypothetical protein